jgi:hypothetical protein
MVTLEDGGTSADSMELKIPIMPWGFTMVSRLRKLLM